MQININSQEGRRRQPAAAKPPLTPNNNRVKRFDTHAASKDLQSLRNLCRFSGLSERFSPWAA